MLEAVRLTEFVLLNVEALRKIVKKMDKTEPEELRPGISCNTHELLKLRQCGTSWQKAGVGSKL